MNEITKNMKAEMLDVVENNILSFAVAHFGMFYLSLIILLFLLLDTITLE